MMHHGSPATTGGVWMLITAGALAVASGLAIAVACSPGVVRRLAPPPPEPDVSDYLPFLSIDDDRRTLRCRHGAIARTWRIEGADHESLDEPERDALYLARCAWLDALAQQGAELGVRIFTIRAREDGGEGAEEDAGEGLMDAVRRRWAEACKAGVYANRHYVCLTARDNAKGRTALEQAESATAQILGAYGARPLEAAPEGTRTREGAWSEEGEHPGTAYAHYCAPASRPKGRLHAGDGVCRFIANDTIVLGPGSRMRFEGADRTLDCAVIGIKGLPDSFGETLSLELQRIPAELTIVHCCSAHERARTVMKLKQEQRVTKNISLSDGEGEASQIQEAASILQGTHESGLQANLWDYTLIVCCYGASAAELKATIGTVEGILSMAGCVPVREGFFAEGAWWGALPGFPTLTRPWRLLTFPIAAMAIPQSSAAGFEAHDWHDRAMMRVRTASGGTYRYNVHATPDREAVGHTVVVAPTKAGKTTFMCLIGAHALKIPDCRVVMFDRDAGAEIFCLAAGGRYVRFEALGDATAEEEAAPDGEDALSASLNPFHLEDTPANREFLRGWLPLLLEAPPTEVERRAIARAVDVAYDFLPRRERSLAAVVQGAFPHDCAARIGLAKWCGDDPQGRIFNAAQDNSTSGDRLVAYDCTAVFERDRTHLAGPLLAYLMHQIWGPSRATAQPTLVLMDETEPMLRNPHFRTMFARGLQEGRKLRQAYFSCFQRPEAINELGLGDTVRGQCRTALVLRNLQANPDDYDWLELTRSEMDFVRGRTHRGIRYGALIKRYEGNQSAIVDISMSALGQHMKLFTSGRRAVLALRAQIRKHGREQGIERYLQSDD